VEHDGLYAISYPFNFETIFSSPRFKDFFLRGDSNEIVLPDRETNVQISKSSLSLAYNIILRKFYNVSVPAVASSVHPFPDPESGLITYMELNLNAQFVDVKLINPDFKLPPNFSPQRTLDIEELKEAFPLENFQFEGIVVIDVLNVTSEQIIGEIKNTLLNINTLSDANIYSELETHIQTLIGLKNIEIGVSPFFIMNDVFLCSEANNASSLLFKHEKACANQSKIITLCQQVFKNTDQPILFQTLSENNSTHNELVKYYYDMGARSLIICPLKSENGNLTGLLEIVSKQPGELQFQHLAKLQPALPLFTLALERSNENIESQIDKIIKEHFTAIQSAVEWKFTEAAFNYLQHKQEHEAAKMQSITFENVYPLYGAIDVRNSSVERNNAIQFDLLEQLTMVQEVLQRTSKVFSFPLLKDIQFKVEKFIGSTKDTLLSDDELLLYDFLCGVLSRSFVK
jgi:hypothetical protein